MTAYRTLRVAALAAACSLPAATRAEGPEGPRAVKIIAEPSILPTGAICRVALLPERTPKGETLTRRYEGTILRAADNGLLLSVVAEESRTRVGIAARVPIVNRLTSSVGVGRVTHVKPKDVWIPAREIDTVDVRRAAPETGTPGAEGEPTTRPG